MVFNRFGESTAIDSDLAGFIMVLVPSDHNNLTVYSPLAEKYQFKFDGELDQIANNIQDSVRVLTVLTTATQMVITILMKTDPQTIPDFGARLSGL